MAVSEPRPTNCFVFLSLLSKGIVLHYGVFVSRLWTQYHSSSCDHYLGICWLLAICLAKPPNLCQFQNLDQHPDLGGYHYRPKVLYYNMVSFFHVYGLNITLVMAITLGDCILNYIANEIMDPTKTSSTPTKTLTMPGSLYVLQNTYCQRMESTPMFTDPISV